MKNNYLLLIYILAEKYGKSLLSLKFNRQEDPRNIKRE